MAIKLLRIATSATTYIEMPFLLLPNGKTVPSDCPANNNQSDDDVVGVPNVYNALGVTASDVASASSQLLTFNSALYSAGYTGQNQLEIVSNVYVYATDSDTLSIRFANTGSDETLHKRSVNMTDGKVFFVVDANRRISIAEIGLYDYVEPAVMRLYRNHGYPASDYEIISPNGAIMSCLMNGDWQDPPEPERSNLDMFDLSNRFSPRCAQQGMGVYMLSKQDLQDMYADLNDPTHIASIKAANLLYGSQSPLDNVIQCRYYHGLKDDVALSDDTSCLVLGAFSFGEAWNAGGALRNKTLPIIRTEFCSHDFGTIDLDTGLTQAGYKRDDYLDYAPFTRYQIYLPYVGYVSLNPNDIIDGKLGLQLNVNLVTGDGMWIVYTDDNAHHKNFNGTIADEQVILTIPCSLGMDIPIIPAIMERMVTAGINTIGSAVAIGVSAGVAGGVATAGMRANALAGQAKDLRNALKDITDPNQASAYKLQAKGLDAQATQISNEATMGQIGGNAVQQGLGLLQPSPDTTRSGGGFNSDTGTLGAFQPFVLITFPIVATPNGFEDIFGNRACVIDELDNCSGYTQIIALDPNTQDSEVCKYKSEIIALLQSGVYL